jgi:hypothetical protein
MVKPASIPRISGSLACLALLLGNATAQAQQAAKPASSKDTPSEEAIFIPVEYRPPPYQVSVGVRISGKAKVRFSGVGSIAPDSYPGPAANPAAGRTARIYTDGQVYPDSTVYIDNTLKTPTDEKTNVWQFANSNQVVNHPTLGRAVAMHSYWIQPSGSTVDAETGASPNWDIEVSQQLGGTRRISWGLVFGAGLNDINVKAATTVRGNLRAITDSYSLAGVTLPTDLRNGYLEEGSQEYYVKQAVTTGGIVTYVNVKDPITGLDMKAWSPAQRLPDHPGLRDDGLNSMTAVDVIGRWQVKGAYLTARLGPYIAANLGRHFAVRASAGITFTVLGAELKVNETYLIPSINHYLLNNSETRETTTTVTGTIGYFASGELEAFLTQRTGLFMGASFEGFSRDVHMRSDFTQTADLSVSTGTILRTGLTTRF